MNSGSQRVPPSIPASEMASGMTGTCAACVRMEQLINVSLEHLRLKLIVGEAIQNTINLRFVLKLQNLSLWPLCSALNSPDLLKTHLIFSYLYQWELPGAMCVQTRSMAAQCSGTMLSTQVRDARPLETILTGAPPVTRIRNLMMVLEDTVPRRELMLGQDRMPRWMLDSGKIKEQEDKQLLLHLM